MHFQLFGALQPFVTWIRSGTHLLIIMMLRYPVEYDVELAQRVRPKRCGGYSSFA